MPRPAPNLAEIDMDAIDMSEDHLPEDAAHNADASDGEAGPENVVRLSAAVEAEETMTTSAEPAARAEELRLLEALCRAVACSCFTGRVIGGGLQKAVGIGNAGARFIDQNGTVHFRQLVKQLSGHFLIQFDAAF